MRYSCSILVLAMINLAFARMHFRKLSMNEAYKVLREANRLDIIPTGHVITQGIAAKAGFITGVTKGRSLPLSANNNNNEQTGIQEICFSSRGVSRYQVGRSEALKENQYNESSDKRMGRQAFPPPPPDATPTFTTETTDTAFPSTSILSPPDSTAFPPPPSDAGTGTETETEITTDDGDGTDTNPETTTQADNNDSVTCIVIL